MSLTYGFIADDIVKENRINWHEIETIKKWNATVKIPILTNEQIVSFILSCDRDIEFTKKTIVEYFKVRTYAKDIFNGRNTERPDTRAQLEVLEFFTMPTKTRDGYLILYHKLHDNTYWKYNMTVGMKLLCMTMDAALRRYPPAGLIVLFDMQGVTLMHLTKIKLSSIKAFFHYSQEGLPVKLRAIHVLNSVYFVDKIIGIVKPFIKKEIYEMLYFHPPDMDMETFFEAHIDKSCMPSDYGGELPNTRVLHEANTKNLAEMKPFFDAEEEQRNSFFK